MRTTVALTLTSLVGLGALPSATRGAAPDALESWMLGPFVRHGVYVLGPRPDTVFRCPVGNAVQADDARAFLGFARRPLINAIECCHPALPDAPLRPLKNLCTGCSKRSQMLGARGNPRAEAYMEVRRSERVERSNADGPFSAAC